MPMPTTPRASDDKDATDKNASVVVTRRLGVVFSLLVLIACIPARNRFDLPYPRAVAGVVNESDAVRGGHIENKERASSIKKKHVTIGFNHSGIPTPNDHSIVGDVQGGHWEYVEDTTPAYTFFDDLSSSSSSDHPSDDRVDDIHYYDALGGMADFIQPEDGTIKSISLLGERNSGTRWIYG